MLKIGAASRSWGALSFADTAERMRNDGFVSTELCFTHSDAPVWNYNGWCDMSRLTDEIAAQACKTFRDAGIEVVSLGAFSSLLEPDAALLDRNLVLYERYLRIAADNGVPYIATETGFVPGQRGINTDRYETDFDYFKTNMIRLLELAEKYGVDIAYEPCVLDVVPSAKRVRDFVNQIGNQRLKILLDPANLIAASDEEDMYKYLAPHVAYFHGKDRKVNDTYGRIIGDGDIDWVKFLQLYHTHTPGAPIVLEYINADNAKQVADRLRAYNVTAAAR